MDMLYRAYSCPMDLMKSYINRGRFGSFVEDFLTLDFERRKDEAEKEQDRRLWDMYIHSTSNEDFGKFKERILAPASTTKGGTTRASGDFELDEMGADAIIKDLFQ